MHQSKDHSSYLSSSEVRNTTDSVRKPDANPGVRRRLKLRPHTPGAAMLAGCLLFSGCTSTTFNKVSAKDAANLPVPINAQIGAEPVSTTLNTVIVFEGPGSWKREASWDEYAVTLRNHSSKPVTITSATLFDYAGVAREPGVHPWALEKQSETLGKQYADAGVSFVRDAGNAATSVGASSTAGNAASVGSARRAPAVASLVPAVLVTKVAINQVHKHSIEREFNERRLALPLVLQPGEERSGSLFFPMVPSPQGLGFTWADQAGETTTSGMMPLPMLNGLHVDTTKSAKLNTSEHSGPTS